MSKSGFDGKEVLRISGLSTLRYRTPTSPAIADKMMQFTADYSRQQALIPNRTRNRIVQDTQDLDEMPSRTTNKGGRSAALGPLSKADIGSLDDEPGGF
jgi:hypothetical protein